MKSLLDLVDKSPKAEGTVLVKYPYEFRLWIATHLDTGSYLKIVQADNLDPFGGAGANLHLEVSEEKLADILKWFGENGCGQLTSAEGQITISIWEDGKMLGWIQLDINRMIRVIFSGTKTVAMEEHI